MNFSIDYEFSFSDKTLRGKDLASDYESHRSDLADIVMLSGRIAFEINGQAHTGDYEEPVVRLVGQWIRKLQWIISGDTETIPFRDSEQCFGFMPAGQGVEFSQFYGTELEVDEYVIEPVTIRLDKLVGESLIMGERLLELIAKIDESLLRSDEYCSELKGDLEEARQAWRDYELHR
ncbi:MAG: hypothetical protein VYA34_16605 [Myxococcota bacterium]|nr:hypothetical protein [Myxococcota bacterium]